MPVQALKPVERPLLERPCQPNQDDRHSDLCAQWKAADAANKSAFWTRLSFWLGLVGTVGLFWTLYYTRKAVRLAIDATDDAEKALEIASRNADAATAQVVISQDTAKRQLRPYVSVKLAHCERIAQGYSPKTVVTIINAGRTPAYEMVAYSGAVVSEDDPGVPLDQEFTGGGKGCLGPGNEHELPFELRERLDSSQVIAFRLGNLKLYLFIRVTYKDTFGDEHRLFHKMVNTLPIEKGAFRPCADGNDIT